MIRRNNTTAGMLLCIALGGCASVDFDKPKPESHAFANTEDTFIGREVSALGEIPEDRSGFHLLDHGVDALSSRLLLAERAERSIDAQYYLAYADTVGYLSLQAMLDAANRGVRVRLLLDDFLTGGLSKGLLAMDTHPNIEVRIYNPFARRWFRLGDFLLNFGRVNRRMHNKVYIVDNQVTIIGGRNIADEYFAASDDVNFGDLDALGVGPVVAETSAMFDAYWNHRLSVPIHQLIKPPEKTSEAVAELRQRMTDALADVGSGPYAAALETSTVDYLEGGVDLVKWVPYQFFYDPPEKPTREEDAIYANSILTPLRAAVDSSEQELIVVSPYFVMMKQGIETMGEFVDRGVKIKVITNSLASNNHALVHSGYAPTRKPLLKKGVVLFETRPDAAVQGVDDDAGSGSTLHTKAFLVDRRWLFLGSFNWDPRSAYINTESGVIIDDADLAAELGQRADRLLPTATYEVYLDEKDRLRWKTTNGDDSVEIFTTEPETGWWTRFKVRLMSLLPVKGQL